jgi:hypothetical protein
MSNVRVVADNQTGVAEVTVRCSAYPQVAKHWQTQLTGARARQWGRIWIDPSSKEAKERRKDALWQAGESSRGLPGFNLDECPGAMFIWQTQKIAHTELCCATQNQAFGRELYWALRAALGKQMGWWEVRFVFVP